MKPPSTSLPNKAAFTLVEILVSLVVVAILLGLLLPVVSRQTEAARGAACVVTLRNLGVAVRLWRNENSERLMEIGHRPSRYLFDAGALPHAETLRCPSRTTPEKGAWFDITVSWGSAYQIAFLNQPISYGVNSFAFFQSTPPGWGSTMTSTLRMFQGREHRVPLFLDAKAWQLNASVWPGEARFNRIILPHQGRCNVLFLDGHVETLAREELLALNPLGEAKPF